jgi:hypothetical protein
MAVMLTGRGAPKCPRNDNAKLSEATPREPPADIIEHLILQARERLVKPSPMRIVADQWEPAESVSVHADHRTGLEPCGATRRRGYV